MSPAAMLPAVLALAVLLAWLRLALRQRRAPVRAWRFALLVLLQPACAGLLYLALAPPSIPTEAGTMTALTAGAARAGPGAQGEVRVALPEAPSPGEAEPVPDLATALRRHPGTSRLQVVGAGLDVRDRDAARGLALSFQPPPLPRGLVRLHAPERVAAGAGFQVSGRAHDLDGGQARLLDPAGRAVDAVDLDGQGAFRLAGAARAPGLATFSLWLLDADGNEVETARVPLHVADDPAPRVLLLAGAPNPEFRHLRRWAGDAGLSLHVEVAVGAGVGLGDGPAPATAEALGEFDLVILDGRTLAALGPARRAALGEALRTGTGVLLRVEEPPSAEARRRFGALGMGVSSAAQTAGVRLPRTGDADALRARIGPGSADAPFDSGLADEPPPELLRRALTPAADDAVPLLSDDEGAPFTWWRAQGRGRIGLWTLVDSHRLALAGRGDMHGELWSAAVAALARPQVHVRPQFEPMVRSGRRTAICGLEDVAARVQAPDGTEATLLVDPATGPARCAAYWPQAAGWHLLRAGDHAWPFHVRAADELPGVAAAELGEQTLRLAAGAADVQASGAGSGVPRRGPSWPWFLGWLLAAGALWWLERSRPEAARPRS